MAMRDKIEHAIQNQPCTVKDLKNKFGGDRGADRKVMEAVDQLVHEAVICQRQGVFFTVRSGRADKALLCKVVKLGKNFAFVMLEDGTSDIFIPGRFTRGAMPGDKVLVEKFAHPRVEGSDEGEILAVLEEKNSLVGTMHRMEGRLKFVPDDCPAISMQVMRDCEGSAKDGDKVAVEILLRGSRQEDHRVGVAMRFGSCDEAKRCAKALLYAQDIRNRFPDKVRDEAKKLDNAEVSAADCEGRMDLRALPIFTIDSAETKDIDDAISLTKTPDGGFELGVHIADVSNYVKPGSELDNEAFNRATSVYYADQVVPMLPKQLSNGICSLNEGVLRLAFSCLMRLDKDGNLTNHAKVPVYKTEKITKDEVDKLTPTRPGYNFTGWYTTADGKPEDGKFDVDKTEITKDITLYAGWDKAPVYHPLTVTGGTATVEKDGQSLVIDPVVTGDKKTYSVPEGAEVTVTLDKTAVPNGKVFDGWSTGNLSLPTGQDCKAESITFPMNSGVNVSATYRNAATDHTPDTAVCHPLTVTGGIVTVKNGDKDVTDTLTVTTDETTGKKTYYVPEYVNQAVGKLTEFFGKNL